MLLALWWGVTMYLNKKRLMRDKYGVCMCQKCAFIVKVVKKIIALLALYIASN